MKSKPEPQEIEVREKEGLLKKGSILGDGANREKVTNIVDGWWGLGRDR